MTKTKTETKRKTIAVSRESDEKSRKKKSSAATGKGSAKAKEKTVTDSSVKAKRKTGSVVRSTQKAHEGGKAKKSCKSKDVRIKESGFDKKSLSARYAREKRRRSGRTFFLASILLTVFSVGLMFFKNADLQVYAKEVSQAIASTVGIDTTPPTLNAAVSDGYLQIVAEDTESKVDKLFVCGYEYSGLLNNALSIRLQQFDAGYEQFSIYAVDSAGNISQEYLVPNPYYDPAGNSTGDTDALPIDASATNATSATGTVTEHSTTASSSTSTTASRNSTRNNASGSSESGNSTASSTSGSGRSAGNSSGSSSNRTGSSGSTGSAQSDAKRSALEEADASENGAIPMNGNDNAGALNGNEGGKEFYTIKTGNDKTFYLVIDRNKGSENVHFLTDISERDLLNTTQDNSATLPRNSASIAGSSGNLMESALPNNNPLSFWQNEEQQEAQTASQNEGSEEKADGENDESSDAVSEEDTEKETDAPGFALPAGNILRLVLLGVGMFAVAVIVVMIRKKRKGDADEADEDEDDEEDEETEDGEEDPEEDNEEEAEEGDPEDEDDEEDDDEG